MAEELQRAIIDFTNWRNSHNRRSKFPDALKARAVALLNNYSSAKLCTVLGISASALRCWQKNSENKNFEQNHFSNGFIPILPPTNNEPEPASQALTGESTITSTHSSDDTITLTLQLSQGVTIKLPEQSITKTAKLLAKLTKEITSCYN